MDQHKAGSLAYPLNGTRNSQQLPILPDTPEQIRQETRPRDSAETQRVFCRISPWGARQTT